MGTLVKRKNIETAVHAFSRLATQLPDLRLTIVGKPGSASRSVASAIRESRYAARIMVLHDVSDHDLTALYQRASALVMPSFCEGFGIPIVEAMASGLPVVASDIEVFREIGSDAALYYGRPDDSGALAKTIATVLHNKGQSAKMAPLGMENVTKYSRDHVAQRYVEIYEEVLGNSLA